MSNLERKIDKENRHNLNILGKRKGFSSISLIITFIRVDLGISCFNKWLITKQKRRKSSYKKRRFFKKRKPLVNKYVSISNQSQTLQKEWRYNKELTPIAKEKENMLPLIELLIVIVILQYLHPTLSLSPKQIHEDRVRSIITCLSSISEQRSRRERSKVMNKLLKM